MQDIPKLRKYKNTYLKTFNFGILARILTKTRKLKNMKKNNFSRVLAATILLILVASCNSKKRAIEKNVKQRGEVLIENYCSGKDYSSTNKIFRANAIGESSDQMVAKKKARSNAQAELAKTISSTMKIVGDNFVKSSEFNNKEELTETFNEMTRTIVDQELTGAIKICEKFTKTPEGNYKCYLALELSGEKIVTKYNERLSKNEQIKADYNYEKFKETFEKEMEKLSNRQ